MAGAAADDKEMPRGVEKGHPVIAHQKDCADRVEHPTSKHPTEHRNERASRMGFMAVIGSHPKECRPPQ